MYSKIHSREAKNENRVAFLESLVLYLLVRWSIIQVTFKYSYSYCKMRRRFKATPCFTFHSYLKYVIFYQSCTHSLDFSKRLSSLNEKFEFDIYCTRCIWCYVTYNSLFRHECNASIFMHVLKVKICHYGNFGKQVGFLKKILNRSFHNWTHSATDMTKIKMLDITVDYRLYVEIITFRSYLNTSFLYLNNFFRTRLYHITYTFYFQKYDFLVLSN